MFQDDRAGLGAIEHEPDRRNRICVEARRAGEEIRYRHDERLRDDLINCCEPLRIATGAAVPAELSVIDAYAQGHPETKGYFAVDAGSTQSIAQTMQKHDLRSKGVKAGGYDLTPITQKLLAADQLDFTIDQQPYLQGFIPILQLFMYQASQTLSGIADTNTGLKFLDKTTVAPYNDTKSRYEGTSDKAGVAKA